MRISASKSKATVLCQKTVERWGGRLPQARESSHPGMSFTSDGKVEHEMDRRIDAASAVMKTFYRTVEAESLCLRPNLHLRS